MNENNLYNITYKCLDASKYEVPQKRERVIFIGIKNELNRLSYEIALAIGKIAREKYLKKI